MKLEESFDFGDIPVRYEKTLSHPCKSHRGMLLSTLDESAMFFNRVCMNNFSVLSDLVVLHHLCHHPASPWDYCFS